MKKPETSDFDISEAKAKTIPFFARKNQVIALLGTFSLMSLTQLIKVVAVDEARVVEYLNMLPWIVLANLTLSALVLVPVYLIIRLLLPVNRVDVANIQRYLLALKEYDRETRLQAKNKDQV